MTGVLVRLVPRTTFVFDDLPPAGSVETRLVRNMPLFAWRSGSFVARIEANSMFSGGHSFLVQLRRTAPTPEDPHSDFPFSLGTLMTIAPADPIGVSRVAAISGAAPVYADLVVTQRNTGGGTVAGSLTISIDAIVYGRAFDQVEDPPAENWSTSGKAGAR